MLTLDQLKQVVHDKRITRADTALLCVAAGGGNGVTTAAVRKLAVQAGVKGAQKVNFSKYLVAADDKVFKTPDGWELNEAGRKRIAALAGETLSVSPAAMEAQTLRDTLPKVKDDEARAFLREAVVCAEQSLYRAAVVLSWAGAVALLQDAVIARHLSAFNQEASRRDRKWKAAKSRDDLGRMKEYTLLQVVEAISMLGSNVKQELEGCLRLRNSCGHPTSLRIGANKVAAHLEILALNVYAVYA